MIEVKSMGKIDEFEQKLIKRGMTDEDFVEYGKLLKRVRGNFLKRQHCYITATQFPRKYAEQALKLIQYGLDQFEDDWFSTYTSYLHMARIYERDGKYQKAFEYYQLARAALGVDHPDYVAELSKDLMWMKLHVDAFRYSKELEDYLLCVENEGNEFSKSFINTEFKLAVAGIVIAMYYGKMDEAKKLHQTAQQICKPNYIGKLYEILAYHRYTETLKTTPESMAFLRKLKL